MGKLCAAGEGRGFVRQERAEDVMIQGMHTNLDKQQLAADLKKWAAELGFARAAISGVDLTHAEPGLLAWLAAGYHGEMDYMARHGLKRARPAELQPGVCSVLSVFMPYWPLQAADPAKVLGDSQCAYVSRYA